MSGTQSRILKFLEDYKDQNGECTPSHKEIASALGISVAHVGTLLRDAAKKGRIEIQPRWKFDISDESPFVVTDESKLWIYRGVGVGPFRLANLYRIARIWVLIVSLAGSAYYVNFRKWLESSLYPLESFA